MCLNYSKLPKLSDLALWWPWSFPLHVACKKVCCLVHFQYEPLFYGRQHVQSYVSSLFLIHDSFPNHLTILPFGNPHSFYLTYVLLNVGSEISRNNICKMSDLWICKVERVVEWLRERMGYKFLNSNLFSYTDLICLNSDILVIHFYGNPFLVIHYFQLFPTFVQKILNWFCKEGFVNSKTWEYIGESLKTEYHTWGPSEFPKDGFVL